MDRVTANKGLEAQQAVEAYLKPLASYRATCKAFSIAEQALTNQLGVPICMQGCGKCCQVTSVTVWDVEARFITSWLLGLPEKDRENFLATCEGWLLDRHPRLTTYNLGGFLDRDQWGHLKPEVDFLLYQTPCPMLTGDKECLVHDARPLVCHAYGVTRMPGQICPRPLSRLEKDDVRGHIGSETQLGILLRQLVVKVLQDSQKLGWEHASFLPTAVFRIMRPSKFNAYVADGKIASAKLAVDNRNVAILFQHQLNDVWAREIATVS